MLSGGRPTTEALAASVSNVAIISHRLPNFFIALDIIRMSESVRVPRRFSRVSGRITHILYKFFRQFAQQSLSIGTE